MPNWPSDLPEPIAGSLVIAPRDDVLSFQADIGEPITRSRTTARLVDYQGQLYLSEAQRQQLDDFHRVDCARGTLSFDMTDWLGGTPARMKWVAPPTYQQAGPSGKWSVGVAFVKLP